MKSLFISLDKCICVVNDFLRRTVVSAHINHFYLWKIFGKIHHDRWIRSTPRIKRLIVISNYTKVICSTNESVNNIFLNLVSILIFIHLNIIKMATPFVSDFLVCREKFFTFYKHIIEINFSTISFLLFISIIYANKQFFVTTSWSEVF